MIVDNDTFSINKTCSIRKPVTAGEMVVARAMEQGELDDLQRRWRKHFLDIMKPNYLPQLWSINHRLQQQ